MEECSRDLIKNLLSQDTILIVVTARKGKFAEITDQSLRNLGFDFATYSRLGPRDITFEGGVRFYNGVFYTGNINRKVLYLPQLIAFIGGQLGRKGPFTMHHIDDSRKEIDAFHPGEIKPDGLPKGFKITIKPILYNPDPNQIEQELIKIDIDYFHKQYILHSILDE